MLWIALPRTIVADDLVRISDEDPRPQGILQDLDQRSILGEEGRIGFQSAGGLYE